MNHRLVAVTIGLVVGLGNMVLLLFLEEEFARNQLPWMLAMLPMFAVAAVLTLRVPDSSIGWLLLGIALLGSFGNYTGVAGWDGWLAAAGAGLSTFGIALLALLLLLFPDGALPSPRWRPVRWHILATAGLGLLLGFLVGGWGGDATQTRTAVSPLFEATEAFTEPASRVFFALMGAAQLAALASLVVRYRAASSVVRHQLRWLLVGVALLAGTTTAALARGNLDNLQSDWEAFTLAIGMAFVPIAIGIAVLRYRLYDVDIVISKTVTFGALAVFIAAVYAIVVVGIGALLDQTDEPNLWLSIAATAIIAVLFEPLHSRVRRVANRLVYGEKSTPYAVLAQLSARFASTGAPDDALGELARMVAAGTGAERAHVWVKVGKRLRRTASWPPTDQAIPAAAASLETLDGDAAVPVTEAGEMLGALGIDKARSDPVTEADRRLLEDIAAGAALLIRNIRLNAELVDRAEQLRASRRRLVAAHDAERHRLERDLHDGAQQQVVALKVKLGLAKTIAEREGVGEVAGLVSGIADDTQEVVDAMRVVARGIYPPLLEAEGLGAALEAACRSAPIRLEIDVNGIGRFPKYVEETVYFCVLETVEGATQAGAKEARVGLATESGELVVQIEHDGRAVAADLETVFDRMDAFGGSTVVAAGPRGGTRITGRLPAQDATAEAT